MRKILFLLAATATLFLSACSKDDVSPGTGVPTTKGRLKLVNNSNNPYYVTINGASYGQVPGKKYSNEDVSPGSYHVEVKQVSGYVVYPTVREFNTYVSAGQEVVLSFP